MVGKIPPRRPGRNEGGCRVYWCHCLGILISLLIVGFFYSVSSKMSVRRYVISCPVERQMLYEGNIRG